MPIIETSKKREYDLRYKEKHHLFKTERRYTRFTEEEVAYILANADVIGRKEMAEYFGCHPNAIYYQLKKHAA